MLIFIYLWLDFIPNRFIRLSRTSFFRLVIVLLESILHGSLDLLLEVPGVCEDGADQHDDEQGEDDGEVCPQHALVLLHRAAAPEEGDEDGEDRDDDDDVRGGGVERDVGDHVVAVRLVVVAAEVRGLVQDVHEGGLVHQHPDAAAHHRNPQSLEQITIHVSRFSILYFVDIVYLCILWSIHYSEQARLFFLNFDAKGLLE